jgi:molecular chaperone GrpE
MPGGALADDKQKPRIDEGRETPDPGDDDGAHQERLTRLEDDLRRKSEEAANHLDRYLRAVAEGENFKKRLQREKSDAIRFANEGLLRDLLQVIDSLEAALEHSQLGGNGKSVVEGIQLTLRLFRDVLDRHGVKELDDPTGAAFDPSTQEAAGVAANPTVAPNTVIQQQTKGYRYNDRLLRPSRVVVAGGGSPGKEDPDDQEPIH